MKFGKRLELEAQRCSQGRDDEVAFLEYKHLKKSLKADVSAGGERRGAMGRAPPQGDAPRVSACLDEFS